MTTELLCLNIDRATDPDGSRLQRLLDMRFAYDRAQLVRRRWAWITVGTWSATVLGHSRWLIPHQLTVPQWAPALVAAVCYVITLRAALTCVTAWSRHRRWTRALSAYPGSRAS